MRLLERVYDNPVIVLLVGLPGVGKSTWVDKYADGARVLSTDSIIEQKAAEVGKTYSDVFKSEIGPATGQFFEQLKNALEGGYDVAVDRTNLTVRSRYQITRLCPEHYTRVAVVFDMPPPEVLHGRLSSRPGKHIPNDVMASMKSNFEPPSLSEGFDLIVREKFSQ